MSKEQAHSETERATASCCLCESIRDVDDPELYLNRELNWLEFNAKVLETAMESSQPLLEQVKFLAIFYTNLDEFFMVRVANIYRQYRNGIANTAPDQLAPSRQLAEIRRRVSTLLTLAQGHWHDTLLPQLQDKGISIVRHENLSEKQQLFLAGYFKNEIYPVLTPQAIDPSHPFPTISNVSLNFIIKLLGADGVERFARLRCPSNMPRLIFIPRNKEAKTYTSLGLEANTRDGDIILIEDLMQEHLDLLFPGYEVVSAGLFRITRNTDVEIEEDEADDLLEAVKDSVDQRRFGDVVRLETARGMATELTDFLVKKLALKPFQIYKIKGPLAFSDLIALYRADRPGLKETPYIPPLPAVPLECSLFARIRARDIFLHHPYDSFTTVLDFIRIASEDHRVMAIKQTLYRCGNNSPIVQALIEARRRGKQVTAVVELKARFDEERNITWAEELEKAGVNVVYGLIGMKIHAKLCLVVRREPSGVTRYAHIGTGNYNAATAKIYTDMGLLTANNNICADVTDLFNAMTGYAAKEQYRSLLVSPHSMRDGLLQLIEQEREAHKKEGKGEIIFKCNQLVDKALIRALYQASMAGVTVHLIIRGICCLRPGICDISDTITVKSIVGRYLEHARAYWFRHHGEGLLYIGSADLMPRNLDRRIEVLVPVLEPSIRRHIREDILALQLRDNVRSWELRPDGSYERLEPAEEQEAINAQELLMQYKKEAAKAARHTAPEQKNEAKV